MVTPVERWNFVSVVTVARKSKLDPFYFQNKKIVSKKAKKQDGKRAKTLQRRCFFFSSPPTLELSVSKWVSKWVTDIFQIFSQYSLSSLNSLSSLSSLNSLNSLNKKYKQYKQNKQYEQNEQYE